MGLGGSRHFHTESQGSRSMAVALILWEMKGSRSMVQSPSLSLHSPLHSLNFVVSIPYRQTETQRSAGAHGFPDGLP